MTVDPALSGPGSGENGTDWKAIADAALGTCDSIAAISEKYDVPTEQVDERLSEEGIEWCPGCGWWVVVEDTDQDGYCIDCAPQEDE